MNTTAAATELPRYQSHKVVRAARITGFRPNGIPDAPDLLLGDIDGIVSMLPEWHAKHQPHVGGYFVRYADGYTSFSPAQAFEEGNTLIPTAPRLSLAHIESRIASEHYFTAEDGVGRANKGQTSDFGKNPAGLSQLTFCVLVLRNGTKVVGINHGSIDPNQHSAEQGRTSAREAAVEQIWQLEGYLLRQLVAGN